MQKVLISIIMPVFNAEIYLKKSIESVLNQIFESFELIIVNDNSTDDSENIIKEFVQKYSKIKYINNTNQGVSNARNLGIEFSKGEYITFIDADDYICSNALEQMYLYINKNNNDVCMSGYIEQSLKNKKRIELPYKDGQIFKHPQIITNIIPKMIAIIKSDSDKTLIMGSACRLLLKRDLIEINKIKFNSKVYLAEDLLFCIEVFLKSNSLITMKGCYYYYMRYGNTTLERYRKNFLKESLFFYSEYEKLLRKLNIFEAIKERFSISKHNMYTTAISNDFRYNAPKNYKKKKNSISEIIKIYKSDELIKTSNINNISPFMKRIALKLMKYNMINCLILFFSIKEKIRRYKM